MQCPKWLLDAMAKGESVKCAVWDGQRPVSPRITEVCGFASGGDFYFYTERDGEDEWFENADPVKEAEPEFKPFDKVLMRDAVRGEDDWTLCQYSHFWEETNEHVAMGGLRYDFCIPYEGNKHLLGTTNKE